MSQHVREFSELIHVEPQFPLAYKAISEDEQVSAQLNSWEHMCLIMPPIFFFVRYFACHFNLFVH